MFRRAYKQKPGKVNLVVKFRYARDSSDERYLFNLPMPNGQTLLYIASKEGNYPIIKYMLERKMNAKIKSKVKFFLSFLDRRT